jgi:hypothetical protein
MSEPGFGLFSHGSHPTQILAKLFAGLYFCEILLRLLKGQNDASRDASIAVHLDTHGPVWVRRADPPAGSMVRTDDRRRGHLSGDPIGNESAKPQPRRRAGGCARRGRCCRIGPG